MSLLDLINKPNDIKNIPASDLRQLALEIRQYMLRNVSRVGGHMASSLGVVELTMALHLFLDLPKDKLIFDVGHQSYAHKILTGRKEEFKTLRQFGGISGFPKMTESNCDAFDTGHSSTSISAGLGYVKARELRGTDEKIVAVIGDGALSGGMAFEALNNAGRLRSNFIIVLNDNKMSISENVGSMANYLGNLRTNPTYNRLKQNVATALNAIPEGGEHVANAIKRTKASLKQLLIDGMFFEDMNITYIGPIDGYNIDQMRYAFELASRKENATLVHVITKKGKGYRAAELNPVKFHGIGPFDCKTGESTKKKGETFTDVFSKHIIELAKKDDRICAITAAMAPGTGLNEFSAQFPERFTDVGIAEEHAVTFAAGLAAGGFKPVFAVYSTFLQRAYDQVIHDVCLEGLPVVFAVDRTGIVGHDGETHQGIYTHSFLGHIPGLTVIEPIDAKDVKRALDYAFSLNRPCAVCYPRRQTDVCFNGYERTDGYESMKAEVLEMGSGDAVLFAAGPAVWSAREAAAMLKEQGIDIGLVNLRFINPIDKETVIAMSEGKKVVAVTEENIKSGGIGEKIAEILIENKVGFGTFLNLSLPDAPLKQGSISELKAATHTDGASMAGIIKKTLKGE